MTVVYETHLRNFEFWSGGREFAQKLTPSELDTLESLLEENEPWNETTLNDLFWFEQDYIAELLGTTAEEINDR